MKAQVSVRAMRADDLERVVAIAAGLKDAPKWPPSAYLAALDPAVSPRRIALIAEDMEVGTVTGFAVASLLAPEAELETIAVVAEAQRRGIGGALLDALVDALRFEGIKFGGIKQVHLEVRSGNQAALALYRTRGFAETGRRARYYADPVEDAILMTWRAHGRGPLREA